MSKWLSHRIAGIILILVTYFSITTWHLPLWVIISTYIVASLLLYVMYMLLRFCMIIFFQSLFNITKNKKYLKDLDKILEE